jgi:hypothetical protein
MEYIFTVRKKFGMETVLFPEFTYNNFSEDKENKCYTEYVDVKSEGLQDILREIFKDVNGVSLREGKPSVSRSFTISEGGRMLLTLALGPSCPLTQLSTSVRSISDYSQHGLKYPSP